jgi:hypothetical protein
MWFSVTPIAQDAQASRIRFAASIRLNAWLAEAKRVFAPSPRQ